MSDAYYHCVSSAKAFGGVAEDYYPLHSFIDRGRNHTNSKFHRLFTHHTMGVEDTIREFGATITNSKGRQVPTRLLAEQHITEDLGFIPTPDELPRLFNGGQQGMVRRAKLLMSKALQVLDIRELKD